MKQYILTNGGQLLPITETNQPNIQQQNDYNYLYNQQLTIIDPKNTQFGFIPHHNIYNNHPDKLAQIAKLSTTHSSAIKFITNLIAGNGITFTTKNNKPISEQQATQAHQYLQQIGYQYPNQNAYYNHSNNQNIHQQIARQLYTFGAVPITILLGAGENTIGNTTTIVQKIYIQPYNEFRLGIPEYIPKEFQYQPKYHLYNTPEQWHRRSPISNDPNIPPSPTNPKLTKQQIIPITQYNPNNKPEQIRLFKQYPIYNPTNPTKEIISSYLLKADMGNNIYYPEPQYETIQFHEAVQTPYYLDRFGRQSAQNGFDSQYIVSIYSETFAKDPEDQTYQDQLQQYTKDIRKNMVQSGNMIIQPLPLTTVEGERFEGQIKIDPIPAPTNTPENKIQTKETATETILTAHGIAPELIGIQKQTNSLAAQDKYIWSRLNMLMQQTIDPFRTYIEQFITMILSQNPKLNGIKANIIAIPNQQTIHLFKEYFTIDEIRQRINEPITTPQQKQEIQQQNIKKTTNNNV